MSIKQQPEENSLLRESKVEKTPLSQLLISIIELLIFSHCLGVKFFSNI